MREKLLDLMKNEGLRPSQLAELLEVNPAGISHILAGRNKPGFDLLQKILRRFPRIDPDWLLLDTGPMYRTESTKEPAVHPTSTAAVDDLFSTTNAPLSDGKRSTPEAHPAMNRATEGSEPLHAITSMTEPIRSGRRTVERIVIFYEDRTFESFSPQD